MRSIYLAMFFSLIAAGYFLTTGDPYGTFGVIAWYAYYEGLILAEEELFPLLDRIVPNE